MTTTTTATHGIQIRNFDGSARLAGSTIVRADVRGTPFTTTQEDAEARAAAVNAKEAERAAEGGRNLIQWRAAPLWFAPVVVERAPAPKPARKAAVNAATVLAASRRVDELVTRVFDCGAAALAHHNPTFRDCLDAAKPEVRGQYRTAVERLADMQNEAVASGRATRGAFGDLVWTRPARAL